MNETPCRVSADIRAHHAQRRFYPNEKRIQQAREEIIDAILLGTGWRGHCLADVLVHHLNETGKKLDERIANIAADYQRLVVGSYEEVTLLRAEASKFLRAQVESYIRDQWVEERAAELASEGC